MEKLSELVTWTHEGDRDANSFDIGKDLFNTSLSNNLPVWLSGEMTVPSSLSSSSVRLYAVFLAAVFGSLSVLPRAQAQAAPDLSSVNDQTQTPTPGTGHDYQHLLNETVNFSNSSISFKISFPVAKARGINLPYDWSYNSPGVNPLNVLDGNQPVWDDYILQSGPGYDGWNTYSGIPYAAVSVFNQTPPPNQHVMMFAGCNIQTGMTFTDTSGTMHNLNTATEASAQNGEAYTQTCPNGSYFDANGDGQVTAKPDPNTGTEHLYNTSEPVSGSFVVTDKNGTNYTFPGGATPTTAQYPLWPIQIEDRNGNVISLGGGGNYTDTAGRPGPVVTNTSVTINSGTADQMVFIPTWETISVNYSIAVSAAISQPGVTCFGIPTTVSGTRKALQSLQLPNGESYKFQYNSYGTISEITYPDGGWVAYTWQLPSGSNYTQYNESASWSGDEPNGQYGPTWVGGGCTQLYQTPVLASRTVSFDGTTEAQVQTFSPPVTNWTLIDGVPSGWGTKVLTVTTTDKKTIPNLASNTVYTYAPYLVSPPTYAGTSVASAIPLEQEIDYYDWGRTSMTKKVVKTWYDQNDMASETTTIVPTSQVSGTVYTYTTSPGAGSPSSSTFVYLGEQDDYDWGAGAIPIPATTNPPFSGVSSSRTPTKKTIYSYGGAAAMPSNFPTYATYTQNDSAPNSYTDPSPMLFPPLVSSVTVENGSNTILAQTNYTYDGAGLTPVSATQRDANYGSATYGLTLIPRGNLTQVVRCASNFGSSCTGPTTNYTYDITGQPHTMTDPNGNMTTYSFADSFSDDSSAPSTNAYLTNITYPTTSGGTLTKSFKYSYYLGYMTSSTDENGQTTSYHYGTEALKCTAGDTMFRLTEVDAPDGGKSEYCYNDTEYSPTVQTWKLINSSLSEESIATMDGMEHVVQTQLYTDPGGADNVFTTYNGEGEVFTVSNPTRLSSPPANTTTTNYYDAFGRTIETMNQDGSTRQWCYDDSSSELPSGNTVANCNGLHATTPVTSGTWVDSTDENGNHWQHTSNVFGDLTDVVEPNGISQSPSMETQYSYDTLNDLLTVSQCGAACTSPAPNGPINRSFSYNSLAQLVTGTNPETGTDSYTYDNDGNVLTKVSPALNGNTGMQTIGYCYDSLNRLVGKWSASPPTGCNSTPTTVTASLLATYTYGGSSSSSGTGGRLIDERAYLQSTFVAENTPTTYDPMGRLEIEKQCPLNAPCSSPYVLNYTYDLAGDLTFADNGLASASVDLAFSYTWDGAQHLALAQTTTQPSGWSTSTYPPTILQANETSTPAYDAWGHLVNGQLGLVTPGSGTPVVQVTRTYDNRGRISTETDGSFYSFSALSGSSSGYDSVGNLKYYQDSVMGNWNYGFDTLNRLTAAQNTATQVPSAQFAGAYGCWTYDGFGNREEEAYSNATATPCMNGANDNLQLTITTPTASNQVTNFTYDLAGNVRNDNSNVYYYDVEGRLCAVGFPNGSGGTNYEQYLYDASGARVGKGTVSSLSCNAPTSGNYTPVSEYLIGLGGEQVTEGAVSGGEVHPAHTNVFIGGKLEATYDFSGYSGNGLHFALSDALGTKRAQVTPSGVGTGTLELQFVTLPFGNSLGNPRAIDAYGSGTDATEHDFTGKERDSESGNDYFGARYYESAVGRFLTPDWSAKEEPVPYAKLDDPQTLNLYAYMVNNPTSGVDADGHAPLSWGGFEDCSERGDCNGGGQTQAQQVYNGITRDVANGATVTVKSSQYTNVADAKGMNGAQLTLEAWVLGDDSAAYNWKQTVTESVKSADGHPPNKPFNDADPDTGLYWSADNQAASMKRAAKDGAQAFFYDDPKDFGGVSFKWHADLSLVGIGKGGKTTALWKTRWGFKVDGKTGKTTLENDGKLPGVTQ
jgi:RHS repeat-associated protein